MPKRLHSDQGANFERKIIRELCQVTGSQTSRTTPYHPMGNGMCERFDRALLGMLGTLQPHQKVGRRCIYYEVLAKPNSDIPVYVVLAKPNSVILVYVVLAKPNSDILVYVVLAKPNSDIPVYVVLAKPNSDIPVYVVLAKPNSDIPVYVVLAKPNSDIPVHVVLAKPNSDIPVYVVLAKPNSDIPVYVVLAKPNSDIPVYVVQRAGGTERKRILHRNLLLPLGVWLENPESAQEKAAAPRQRQRRSRRLRNRPPAISVDSSEDQGEDSDDSFRSSEGIDR